MSAYDEINKLYPQMQEIAKNNIYGYTQLYNTTMPAIAVGSMVDDEQIQLSDEQNPTSMTTFQKWGFLDTADNCMANAQKIYSQILFNENKNINNNTISKTNGFLMRSTELRNIDDYKTSIFDNATYQTVPTISNVNPGYIYEYYTYFCPSQSGVHTFSVASMALYFLWISNDNAIYDYVPANSDVNRHVTNSDNGYKFVKVTLKIGEYYPLRIHLYSTVANNASPIYIVNPDGTSVFDDTNNMYFNVLNGGEYNRKLLYFGLRKDNNSSTGYKCDFLDMIPDNYAKIQRMKKNQPILYKKLVIPTPITYTSHIYTSQGSEGDIVQLTCPVGGKIIIDSATWGTGPIEVNEPTYETREYTDPNIIIDTKTSNYTWFTPVEPTITTKTVWTDGMKVMLYDGDSQGDPNWYSSKTPSNKNDKKDGLEYPTTKTAKYTVKNGQSVRISGYINGDTYSTEGSSWPGFVGQFMLNTTSGQTATMVIKDTSTGETYTQFTSSNGAETNNGFKVGFTNNVKNIYSINIYANAGTVNAKTIRWIKDGGWKTRPENVWYEFDYMYDDSGKHFFKTQNKNKQITVKSNPDDENTAQLTTRSYIKPTPTYQAEVANVVTYDGNVDVTNDIQMYVDTNPPTTDSAGNNVYSLDGNYAAKYDDLLPNNVAREQTNKQMTVKYKYTIELTSADVTDKKVLVNTYGQLSISYKYNGETSEYPIAPALNQNNYCDPSNCTYTLTLEDNCSLATRNGGVVVSRDLQSELNADLANYGMTMDNIIVNNSWKNDPINIYSTLNNGDILSNDSTIEVDAPLKRLPYIRSDNGKFKLAFEGDDLSIVYCIPSYFTSNNVNYTTDLHVTSGENPKPYYFLYRPMSDPLTGKIMYTQKNKVTGESEARIVPFSHTDILSNGPINSQSNEYPVLCNSQTEACDSEVNFQNLPDIVDKNYYFFNVSSKEECADKCLSSPECLHFFHINTSNGEQKCLRDAVGNPNPLTTSTNPDPEYISASSISTRTYMLNSDCILGDNEVKLDNVSAFSNYKTLYNEDIPNDVSKTFVCGDPKYQEISNTIDQYFRGETPSTKNTDTVEPFECGTAQCLIDELDNIAANYTTQYIQQQNDVSEMTQKIDQEYKDLGVNVANEDIDRIKKEIPSKYTKQFYSPRPATTTLDIQQSDSKDIAIYENTLYTIGTLSVASILIATIVILKD